MDLLDVHAFIYSRLSEDADLAAIVGDRIYPENAPEETAYPLVAFSVHTSPPDVLGGGAEFLLARPLYLVGVHGRGVDLTELREAWDRVKAVLTSTEASTEGETTVLGFHLEQRLAPDTEHVGGERYARLAGLFRFFAQ